MTVRFDALFQHSPNAYMVRDRHLRYREANPTYALPTATSRARLVGRALATGMRDTLAQCDQLEASLITGETTPSHLLDAPPHEALSPALRDAA